MLSQVCDKTLIPPQGQHLETWVFHLSKIQEWKSLLLKKARTYAPMAKYGITSSGKEKAVLTRPSPEIQLDVPVGVALLSRQQLKECQSDPIQPGPFCNQQGFPYPQLSHPLEHKLNLVCGLTCNIQYKKIPQPHMWVPFGAQQLSAAA